MEEHEQNADLCKKCGQPRGGSGRLTQWIKVCSCAIAVDESAQPDFTICEKCGKRVESGRSGSFTQWVFRPDTCRCGSQGRSGSQAERASKHPRQFGAPSRSSTGSLPVEERFIDSAQFADRIPVERYNIIKGIGQGASGTVLLCSDLVLEKLVAIKSLNQVEPEALVAFQKEARATCTLNHPNIVKVIDFGIAAGGAPYISVRHRRAYQTASQCKKTKGSETSGRPATWYGTGTSCSNSSLTREISIPDDAGWSRVN